MGAFDDLVPGADTTSAPSGGLFGDLVPKRGPIGEIAAAAKRGLYSGVKGAGEVLQAPAEMAGEEPGVISRMGQRLEAYGKQGEAATPLEPEKHSGVTNFLAHAAAAPGEALPLLATTIPAAAAGAGAGSLIAPGPGTVAGAVGGAIAGGVAGGGTTALQTYHEKYHEALDRGLPDDQARAYAKASAAVQGTLMGGVSAVPFAGPLARMAMKAPAETAAKTLADVTGKRFLPELGKGAAELTGVNTTLGAAGAASQAVIDEKTGLPTVSPGEAALASIPGSLAASVGFLPLAVHPAIAAARASNAIRAPLEDAQAPVGERLRAALAVHQAIDQVDPDAAKAWDANATQAIHAGQPVPLDDSVFNGGARGAVPEGEAAPGEHVPSAVDDEPPVSNVNPDLGPLSRAAAMSEHATLPGFPFASPEAAQKSLTGRGEPPEGWEFQVQRHPSIENRWAVTLRQLTKEEQDARPVEGEAGPAAGAAPGTPEEAAHGGGVPEGADLSGGAEGQAQAGHEEAPHLDALMHEAATSPLNDRDEPTGPQKAAGNYKMAKPPKEETMGLPVSVENPAGSIRRGTDADGRPWEQVLHDDYGYIRRTVGNDQDHIDAFVGRGDKVYVVDQVDPKTGKFDEHKVLLRAPDSIKAAREMYLRNYEPGWKGLGRITPTTIDTFKSWLKSGDTTKPFSERDQHATGKGPEPEGDLGQREGIDAGLPGEGADRNLAPGREEGGAEAGGGDRAQHGAPLESVAAPAHEEFTTRKGEMKSFASKKAAAAYQANRTNRVPGNFAPRETPDGWVLSRPVRTRSPAQRANDDKLSRARRTFNPERDPLVTFMGKMGGIRADELLSDGVDPKDLKDLRSGVVGKPAYRTKGGLSLDAMAELAAAHGFDVLDEGGRPDASKLRDLIDEELSGNRIYTPEGYERQASLEAEHRDREERARFENDFDEDALQRSGYDDLSPEGQELVTQAFEDDLDGLIASFEHAGKGLTDEEADHLFRRSTDELPQEAEVAAARGALEDAHHGEEPSLREGQPQGLIAQSARRYGDTEAFEVRAAQGGRPGVAIRSADGQLDLFTQASVPREPGAKPLPGAVYATQVAPAKRGEVRVGFDRINTPERAAHVFAGLRKAPREYFQVLVLDASDKPIAYLDLFHGGVAQTSVYPQIVASAVYQTPGAKSIWLAHNHPSGVPEPSQADHMLTRNLQQHLGADLGVEYRGHVIIAGQRATELVGKPFDIPAAARTITVPIMERRVVKSGKLSTESITSPERARKIAEEFSGGKEGLLIMDHQNRPVAYVPIMIADLKKLRTGDKDTGFGALIQMFAKSGGDQVMAYAPLEDGKSAAYRAGLQNLMDALSGLDFKLLDAIDQRPGTAMTRGDLPKQGYSGFFSRASSGKEAQENDPYARYRGETVTEKVALDDGRTATLTHKADVALRDVDERLSTLRDLLECLS